MISKQGGVSWETFDRVEVSSKWSRTVIYEMYTFQNRIELNSVVFPVCIDVESCLFLYLTRTFNTSVYLTFQISNLLCEKNKNSLTYPLSNLCRKEEICRLPFGGMDWGYWLRTYEKAKHTDKGKGSKNMWQDLKTLESDNKTNTNGFILNIYHWLSLADYLSIWVAYLPSWVVSSFQLQHLAESFALHWLPRKSLAVYSS